jgi:required for meiotic nuclear division protein 1
MHPRTEMVDNPIVLTDTASIRRMSARALRLGRRLKLAGLEIADLNQAEPIATSPLVLRLGSGGFVALFAFGAAVFIGVSRAEEEAFLQKLGGRIEGRLDAPAVVVSELEIGTTGKISDVFIVVHDLSPPCLVIVADALAKNVALAFEEAEVKKVLDVLEPFAGDLAESGRLPRSRRRMLRTVGHALLIHHRLLERVEVEERPELPSNDDEIERLHERLAEACNFKKRAKALSRKLDVIEVMTTAITELLDAQREIRLESLILLLIAVEISVYLYDLFLRAG